MADLKETLVARNSTHGDWQQQAGLSQQFKRIAQQSQNWQFLPDHMKESLEMNFLKVSRILCGNHNEPDHWHDIGGYVKLVENVLTNVNYQIKTDDVALSPWNPTKSNIFPEIKS